MPLQWAKMPLQWAKIHKTVLLDKIQHIKNPEFYFSFSQGCWLGSPGGQGAVALQALEDDCGELDKYSPSRRTGLQT